MKIKSYLKKILFPIIGRGICVFWLIFLWISLPSNCLAELIVQYESGNYTISAMQYIAEVSSDGLLSVNKDSMILLKENRLDAYYDDSSEEYISPPKILLSKSDKNASIEVIYDLTKVSIKKTFYFSAKIPNIRVDILIKYKESVKVEKEEIKYFTKLKNVEGYDHKSQFVKLNGVYRYTDRFQPYISFCDEISVSTGFHLLGNSNIPLSTVDVGPENSNLILHLDCPYRHPHYVFKPIIFDNDLYLLRNYRKFFFRLKQFLPVDLNKSIVKREKKRRVRLSSHSSSLYNKGETKNYEFNFWIGPRPLFVRKQLQPFGRIATIVFTEHADHQSVESVEAVYLGTSEKTSPYYKKKGFIGNRIKVSKSVFAYSDEKNKGLDDPEYKAVIDTLYRNGIEIGPHTMYNTTDGRKLIPGFNTMRELYKSRFWIDHGGESNTNNENLVREGWNPNSESYILDKLDFYGYQYAWSYWDQGYHLRPSASFSFNLLFPENSYRIPLLLWHHNRLDHSRFDGKKIFLFNAYPRIKGDDSALDPSEVEKLIEDRGVHISHSYFPSKANEGKTYERENGFYIIKDHFEKFLNEIKKKIEDKELWNPTISEFGDYLNLIQNIKMVYIEKNKVLIINNNTKKVEGVTFAVRNISSSDLKINGAKIGKFTRQGDDLLFWFDMPPLAQIYLTLPNF
jgi:hypothetical protein